MRPWTEPKTDLLSLITVPVQRSVEAPYTLTRLILVWFSPSKSSQSPNTWLTHYMMMPKIKKGNPWSI